MVFIEIKVSGEKLMADVILQKEIPLTELETISTRLKLTGIVLLGVREQLIKDTDNDPD